MERTDEEKCVRGGVEEIQSCGVEHFFVRSQPHLIEPLHLLRSRISDRSGVRGRGGRTRL
jgi:hypothetical protein